MNYTESEQKLNEIRNRDEVLFRMGISHLMDVGARHLTEEIVKKTCESILQEDDSNSFMTNGYKCAIVRTASEIAKINHIHLLVYIQREVTYDVGNNYEEKNFVEVLRREEC